MGRLEAWAWGVELDGAGCDRVQGGSAESTASTKTRGANQGGGLDGYRWLKGRPFVDVSALSSLSSQDERGLGRASESGIGSDDEE